MNLTLRDCGIMQEALLQYRRKVEQDYKGASGWDLEHTELLAQRLRDINTTLTRIRDLRRELED